jgi:hypothetical protein
MKYLFFLLIFLSEKSIADNRYIYVKYSTSECVFCNVALNSIKNIKDCPIYVVLLESKKKDEEIVNIVNSFSEKNVQFMFSDSLYYKFDSGERSIFYITEGERIEYKQYLKSMDINEITRILNSPTGPVGINYPGYKCIRQTNEHLFMGGNAKYILEINKNDLTSVEDTFYINPEGFKNELFKITYGKDYQKEMDTFLALSKRYSIPNTFGVVDFQVSEDTIWVMVMSDIIYMKNEERHIANVGYIETYVKHKCLAIYEMDISSKLSGVDSNYSLLSANFTRQNGLFYISIRKGNISEQNGIYAQCKIIDNKIVLENILPIYLPDHMVETGIGYYISLGLADNNIFSNEYDNDLYDLISHKKFKLPDGHMQNTFTYEMVSSLHFKVNFDIVSFHFMNHDLSVIYTNGDSLINAHYKYDRKSIQLTSRKLLSYPFPDKEKFPGKGIVCDEKGVYCYLKTQKRFNFYTYK